MSGIDLLITHAAQLLTMHSDAPVPRTGAAMEELGIIEDGALAVKAGKIVAVGATGDVTSRVGNASRVIDATGQTVMPGFVDPHTHLVFAGFREDELELKIKGKSYMEILAMGGGIQRTVRATREASLEELVGSARKRADTMLRYGTTTAEVKSGYGLDTGTELKMLEAVRELDSRHPIDMHPTFLGAHVVAPEYRERPDQYVDLVTGEMIPEVAGRKLARYCDVFCEEGVFSVEQSRRILLAGKEHGLEPRVHADEIVSLGGAGLAAEVGAASADHLAVPSEDGLRAMASAGVVGIPLPATTYALRKHDYSPARKMIELGVPVALATDLNPNCLTESMPFVVSLACYMMGMTPAEAIVASTINAAHSLGIADRVGSLEVGKQADIAILDAPNHRHLPYHFGVNPVKWVVKGGEVVVAPHGSPGLE